jgi:hypothetical protein
LVVILLYCIIFDCHTGSIKEAYMAETEPGAEDVARMDGIPHRPHRRGWLILLGCVALVLVAGMITWPATSAIVSGTVHCTSGATVSGVWVEGATLGHVASVEVNSGSAQVNHGANGDATFIWERHLWGGEEFRVGCGFVPDSDGQWATTSYSKVTSLTHVALICEDKEPLRQSGRSICTVSRPG